MIPLDDLTAGALLREVARLHAQSQRDQVACCGGTTSTQCHILTEVGRRGPMTLTELGRRLGVDKSWTSRAVEALVQEGLLIKEPGDTDRRTVIIDLTPAGRIRFAELNRILDAQSERIMRRIPPGERAQVERALELLQAALRAEAGQAPEPIILLQEDHTP